MALVPQEGISLSASGPRRILEARLYIFPRHKRVDFHFRRLQIAILYEFAEKSVLGDNMGSDPSWVQNF